MNKLDKEQAYQFASFLARQAGPSGRANLAELRRAAMDSNNGFRDFAILGPMLSDSMWVSDAQRLAAGLFALFAPQFWNKDNILDLPEFRPDTKRRSFGASLQKLRRQLRDPGRTEDSSRQKSLDLRVSALLDSPREDLAIPLRGFIQRLATAEKSIPVDFGKLLLDLVHWDYDDPKRRSVRQKWAYDYWQIGAMAEGTTDQPNDTTETV